MVPEKRPAVSTLHAQQPLLKRARSSNSSASSSSQNPAADDLAFDGASIDVSDDL
jgi:hypothetical protein